jgi:hypothetical protein
MTFADKLLAWAQVCLAFLFTLGFFAVLFFLMLFNKQMSTTEITILTGLVSVLGTLLALQQNFFFARTRPPALPDPANTTTTTTTTTAPTPPPTGVPPNVPPLTTDVTVKTSVPADPHSSAAPPP